jgi:Tfp pilus assembly protein PilF
MRLMQVVNARAEHDSPARLRPGSVSSAAVFLCGLLLGAGCAPAIKQAPPPDLAAKFETPAPVPQASPAVREAEALLSKGDALKAKQVLQASLATHAADARAELDLGLALEALGETPAAEAAYRRALAIQPGLGEAHNNLGLLLRDQDKMDAAIEELRLAASATPAPGGVHENLALALEDAGRSQEAEQAYTAAVREAPKNPILRANFGLFLLKAQAAERALVELRAGLEHAQGQRTALIALGNGLRRAGKPDEAVRALRQAVDAGPGPASSAVHTELALALNAAGDAQGAKAALETAITLDAKNAAAHYAVGSIYAQEHDVAKAKQHLGTVIALKTSPELAARAREKLSALETPKPKR